MLSQIGNDSPTGTAARVPPHSPASGVSSFAEVIAQTALSTAFFA